MINYLTKRYYKSLKRDNIKGKLIRIIVRILTQYILPIYLKLTRNNRYSLITSGDNIIVSLTTFPKRINTIWIVLECMLRQTKKPDKIILWLSKEQFNNKKFLPPSLLAYEKRGVEFRIMDGEDLKSHKKYYYSLIEFPKSVIITIDDDFIYPLTLLEDLYNEHINNPNKIIANRALLKKYNKENQLLPYNLWNNLVLERKDNKDVFFTSGGGTLFPIDSLAKEVLAKEVFLKICKNADDVWLNFMANKNNTNVLKINSNNLIIPIDIADNESLMDTNLLLSQNDIQYNKVIKHFENEE